MAALRESKGGAYASRGQLHIRVTVGAQQRASKRVPWATSLDEASARANVLQALVNRLRSAGKTGFVEKLVEVGAVADEEKLAALHRFVDLELAGEIERTATGTPGAKVDTIETVTERWTTGELHRLHPDHVRDKNSDADGYRAPIVCSLPLPPELRAGGATTLGGVPVIRFSIEHAELVMREIDTHRQRIENERAALANRAPKKIPALGAGGRRQYAQQLRRTLELCVYPLKLIKVNPIPRGWLPRVPVEAKGIPYPDEERAVLEDTAHEIHWRIFFGALMRLGFHADEAASLTMSEADVVRGIVTLDENKTDNPRAPSYGRAPGREWYGPSLMRALQWWRETCRKGAKADEPFFIQPSGERIQVTGRLAERWQAMLESSTTKKGIHRPELFKKTGDVGDGPDMP